MNLEQNGIKITDLLKHIFMAARERNICARAYNQCHSLNVISIVSNVQMKTSSKLRTRKGGICKALQHQTARRHASRR